MKRVVSTGFPLKDNEGVLQVSKEGVDGVIRKHFIKVFAQNPVPEGEIWKEYWGVIDQVFESMVNMNTSHTSEHPSLLEVKSFLQSCNDNKSVLGNMKPHLLKLGGDNIVSWIQYIVQLCCKWERLPVELHTEQMSILYKNKGELCKIDNYRGISIRIVILSILQRWLYT